MADLSEGAQIARVIHRFGFGPAPGDYEHLLSKGLARTQRTLLDVAGSDPGLSSLADPTITDLGPWPLHASPQVAPFTEALRAQNNLLLFWWLDRMALTEQPLSERMTWFWHGHFATSVGKVLYALPMYNQNQTLRRFALGNFTDLANAMVLDGALMLWLDANLNVAAAPNENLAREFMELFTIGVGNFSEADVQAVAKALTGYKVTPSNGEVTFVAHLHDDSFLQFLNTSGLFNAPVVATYLTSLADCQTFVPERLWYRFMDATNPQPDSLIANAFATRDIALAVSALVHHPSLANSTHSLVKSPLTWFIGACRALRLQPSTLKNPDTVLDYLGNLSQVPFNPPNVGGWPSGQAWLNVASTQYRIGFAQYLVAQGDLSPLAKLSPRSRIDALAMWLGVDEWSAPTRSVLARSERDIAALTVLGLNAPEYVVNT